MSAELSAGRHVRAAVRGGPRRYPRRHHHGPDSRTVRQSYLKLMSASRRTRPTRTCGRSTRSFLDPQARDGFIARLQRDGSVMDYLLRLRRADRVAIWIEVTAHADVLEEARSSGVTRDVTSASVRGSGARSLHQLLQAEAGRPARRLRHRAGFNNPLATILTWAEASRSVPSTTRRNAASGDPQRVGRPRRSSKPAHLRAQASHDARWSA